MVNIFTKKKGWCEGRLTHPVQTEDENVSDVEVNQSLNEYSLLNLNIEVSSVCNV